MARDENIGADTSGRTGDVGGSTSGGKAGDEQFNAYGEDARTGENPFKGEKDGGDGPHGTPDDLKLGKRRTVGMEQDGEPNELDESTVPMEDGHNQ
jgi:hypothetical protein